jgi:transposase
VLRIDLVTDMDLLRKAALLLEQENRKLIDQVITLRRKLLAAEGMSPEALQIQIQKLEQQLAQRDHALFGRSSEKRPRPETSSTSSSPSSESASESAGTIVNPSTTPDAASPDPASTDAASTDGKTRKDGKPARPGHGRKDQPSLAIEPVPHSLDEADCICPKCGDELKKWEGKFEESEEVHVVERRFVILKHKREKSRCECGHIETALGPDKLVKNGRYSIDFAIHVALGKYLDHMPLERQVRGMARDGLNVDSQTLFDQLYLLTRRLLPAYQNLRTYVLSSPVVLVDETRWPLLSADGIEQPAPSKWHFWGIARLDAVYYKGYGSRGNDAAEDILNGFVGTLVSDHYKVYDSITLSMPDVRRAGCWTHSRRDFVEIEAFFPRECGQMIGMIGELYSLERGLPPGPEGDDARRVIRDTRSRQVIHRIRAWCLETSVRPGSGLETAIQSIARHWKALTLFLDDPRIPLDTNGVERGLRGPVVGRKNHYGSRSVRGVEVASILYSFIETAKLVGVDPRAYLGYAVRAAIRGDPIPLPHEFRKILETQRLAESISNGESPAK